MASRDLDEETSTAVMRSSGKADPQLGSKLRIASSPDTTSPEAATDGRSSKTQGANLTTSPTVQSSSSAEVQRLLQRAESQRSRSASDEAEINELQRRVEALAPPDEVLRALQAIYRRQNETDVDLPQYDDGTRRS